MALTINEDTTLEQITAYLDECDRNIGRLLVLDDDAEEIFNETHKNMAKIDLTESDTDRNYGDFITHYINKIDVEMKKIIDVRDQLILLSIESTNRELEARELARQLKYKESKLKQVREEIEDEQKDIFHLEEEVLDLENTRKAYENLEALKDFEIIDSSNEIGFKPIVENAFLTEDTSPNKNTLSMQFSAPPEFEQTAPNLQLSVDFDEPEDCSSELLPSEIEVDLKALRINDLADEARKDHDYATLATTVQERWVKSLPLFDEVKRLQNRYDVVWPTEDEYLKVVLPSGRSCLFTVPSNYPDKEVLLDHVDGMLPDEIKHFMPADPSLSGWMQLLEDFLKQKQSQTN